MLDFRRVILVLAALSLSFGFISEIRGEEKKTEVKWWPTQRENLVILNFSSTFPVLGDWDRRCLLNELITDQDVLARGVDMRRDRHGTVVYFIGEAGDHKRIGNAVSIIKKRIEKNFNVKIKRVRPLSRRAQDPIPDASTPRVVLLKLQIVTPLSLGWNTLETRIVKWNYVFNMFNLTDPLCHS